jgi:putative nucleotidyltransferase with HDIG domain/PAS domain S-box-containing protein
LPDDKESTILGDEITQSLVCPEVKESLLMDVLSRKKLWIVIFYAVIGTGWILGSDLLLFHLFGDIQTTFLGSTLKGLLFVALMSLLLYFLLYRLEYSEKRAQQAEIASELQFFTLPDFFGAIPVIVYVLEGTPVDRRAIWVSHNIEKILHYSVKDALTDGWWERHLHPDDREQSVIQAEDILRKGGGTHEYRFRHADGSYIFVKDELHQLAASSGTRFIGVWTDISQRYQLEQNAIQYAGQLEQAMFQTVDAVAKLTELRDPYTSGHEKRVGEISAAIAAEMGFDERYQEGLHIAGLLHDIGKIGVPSEILVKPARLSAGEYALVKEHTEFGYQVLRNVDFPWPVADIARQHHERIDGSGYPLGLKGDQITMEARIVAIADVVESMASHRPYRPGLGIDVALAEIESNIGKLYDIDAASACLRLFRDKGYPLT